MPDSEIRRVNDDPRDRIQRPRSTDSDRFNSWSFSAIQKQRFNRSRHRGEALGSLTGGDHRGPTSHMNFSASIYQTSGNLRSSDIYSDEEFGCRFHLFRILFCTGGSVRQSVRSLEARELYMPSRKSASSQTRNGLVWQKLGFLPGTNSFGISCHRGSTCCEYDD